MNIVSIGTGDLFNKLLQMTSLTFTLAADKHHPFNFGKAIRSQDIFMLTSKRPLYMGPIVILAPKLSI